MAKATFHRRFDATDTKRGISVRIEPTDGPQTFPAWIIDRAVQAGAATREQTKPARRAKSSEVKDGTA
ncbi:hypothetical protein SAMN05444389_101440 [Paracoccus solventivorans]|uniref:Uncharacterized protein n=1 Tax=Paracoccus solventivorans TaxID=53463 RepID=A0A1M7DM50_9RHOB|nr:hypothetical protein [Paracoccus solventivorans]SHL80586.1 hypothetical protein SAMN05444389_101440 [Paracoccus solventivorans]